MADGVDDLGVELRRAVFRLYSRFRSERVEGEVGDAALLVLMVLSKREPMSLSDLAETAHVTLGSMTQTVRRLEQLDHVSKARDARDGRKVLFRLTTAGREAADASRRHREDWLTGRLDGLNAAERELVARAAPLLLRLADS